MKTFLLVCLAFVGLRPAAQARYVTPQDGKAALAPAPAARADQDARMALGATGWKFAAQPSPAMIDIKSGTVRFEVVVNEAGKIESAIPTNSSVSKEQEKACHQALLDSTLIRVDPKAGRATCYYNFRFSVR